LREPSDEDSSTNQQDVRKRSFAGVAKIPSAPWGQSATGGLGRRLPAGGLPDMHPGKPNICLPRLSKACLNSSKWRESLGIRGSCQHPARSARRASSRYSAGPNEGFRVSVVGRASWPRCARTRSPCGRSPQ
jgi:hypothetical protein